MAIEQERTFEVPPHVCPEVVEILARLNDKWSIRILRLLRPGRVRFNELQRALGPVTHKMLTQTLRGLQRDGLVTRHLTPTAPLRTDYELSPLGLAALVPIDELARWAIISRSQIHEARAAFDVADSRRHSF